MGSSAKLIMLRSLLMVEKLYICLPSKKAHRERERESKEQHTRDLNQAEEEYFGRFLYALQTLISHSIKRT